VSVFSLFAPLFDSHFDSHFVIVIGVYVVMLLSVFFHSFATVVDVYL